MSSGETCRECGAVIPEGGPPGLCGRCLLQLGLEHKPTAPETSGCAVPEGVLGEDAQIGRTGESASDGPRNIGSVSKEVVPALEQPGERIGRYKLLQNIGEGGWGVVYMAEQEEPVRRRVALKVIKLGMDTKQVVARFEAERQALALMDHPNIAKVLDAGSTEKGRPYFVMELVRGIRITTYCDERNLSTSQRLDLFVQVCQAIQHAHHQGIIHRDIKPSNILVTVNDGVPVPKVIDFGIAKATAGPLTDKTLFTAFEQFIGTPAYMSPEQAVMTSLDIDARSDIYSLGVLLYELLTSKTPFDTGELLAAGLDEMRRIIREQEPVRPSTRLGTLQAEEQTTVAKCHSSEPPKLIHLVRGDLDWIVMKCLEKDRSRRYETANGLAADLRRHLNNEPVIARPPSAAYRLHKRWRRNKLAFIAAAVVTAALVLGITLSRWHAVEASRARNAEKEQRFAAQAAQKETEQSRWARERALPEIHRLVQEGSSWAAFALAREAERYAPNDPVLTNLLGELSVWASFETTPRGADIYDQEYRKPDSEWEYLGKSPVKGLRLPKGFHRFKIRKEGYVLLERAGDLQETNRFRLDSVESLPPGMVRVEGGDATIDLTGLQHLPPVQLEDYLIDKFEVSNRQFQEFIDQGGYVTTNHWKYPFLKQGKALTWTEAIAEFRDATGQAGPATWMNGTYPEEQADYPVAGISWFEAAAYADFAGKRLPSLYHWSRAAAPWVSEFLVPLCNFARHGSARVGSYQGLSWCGVYDLAGNVKEWCWNEAGLGHRYILGGAWNEPAYMFEVQDAQSPFDRLPTFGFRCMKPLSTNALPKGVDDPVVPADRNYAKEQPVSEEAFQNYKSFFSYDKTALNARVELVDDSREVWRTEKVSFKAAYGDERVTAYLFLPRKRRPPFQAVVYFPGSEVIQDRSREPLLDWMDFIVENGRAVVCPVYKGTFERSDDLLSPYAMPTSFYRDHVIMWSKDLGRAIDYLETRIDIQHDKLAYCGLSWGAALGALLPALENRLKASVLVSGGLLMTPTRPEVDQINFAPRVTVPTLMINGRRDFIFPVESSQNPMFRLLGTAPGHKRHVIFESGHTPPQPQLAKEIESWLDLYLGPVK